MKSILPIESPLYMRYEKILPSAQGMAIYGDMAFVLYHTGVCAVYNLADRTERCMAKFPLGSFNPGIPTMEYLNHSNQCMFSSTKLDGYELPLLYVTTGNKHGGDDNGYYYRCAVEQITLENCGGDSMSGSSRLIQTISYKHENMENSLFEPPCFGCPAWFVDSQKGYIYIFSARWRTTAEFLPYYEQNRYIVSKFSIPNPQGEDFVMLGPQDILDQFILPYDVLFTQGGTLHNGKIYYSFGLGNVQYPLAMRIIDIEKRCYAEKLDLSHCSFAHEEIESCAFYGDELFCNTNAPIGGIYSLGKEF